MSTPTLITARPGELDQLAVAKTLAKWMDTAVTIPGTNIKMGLDTLLGLLPGVGDLISSAIGSYIIVIAGQLGVSRPVIWRMMSNQLIDMVIGAVPLVGDVLDVGWKANTANVRLMERALADPAAARRASAWALAGLVAVL
ncbi:MAG: DUF4112 domain-containing protein, partial [Gemmataceae bacterium]|nr:DUF4112 domain-containing protein [Gemmataceae bacterium]